MSLEKIIEIQHRINSELKKQQSVFEKIKFLEQPLINKWQQFIGIILPIQLQVIQEFGFAGDQSGLSQFNEKLMELSSDSKILRQINEDKWRFLLEKAFGLTEYKPLSLQEARLLIKEIAEAMVCDEFLAQIDRMTETLNDHVSLFEKRQELLKIILPLHMSIMSKYGLEGETGYIQAQRALMDYYHDPFIKETASYAQQVVFKRAELLEER